MQTVIRTVFAIALLGACGSDDKKDSPGASPTPEPTPEPVAVAPDAESAPAPEPAPAAPDAAPAAPEPAPEPAAAGPKNLKVLPRSWSEKKLEKYMKEQVSKALGVKCKECHDTDDFAKDDKKDKQIARDMIAMQNDINRQFFKGKTRVTCMTCHMGSKEPQGEE